MDAKVRGWVGPKGYPDQVPVLQNTRNGNGARPVSRHYVALTRTYCRWFICGEDASAVSLSERGVIETTMYSHSLLSRSSTRSNILSFCSRNCACSPTGRSTGCFLVARTNAINHPLGLQHVFLAEHVLRFLVARILYQAFLPRSSWRPFRPSRTATESICRSLPV